MEATDSQTLSHEISNRNIEHDHITQVPVEVTDKPHVLVELWPFVNQVGGHTCVLEVDGRTICKPYVEREVWFYEHVPEQLREFTPQYYGAIDVKYDVIKGNRRLIACIPTCLIKQHNLLLHKNTADDIISHCQKRCRKRSREFREQTSPSKEMCSSENDNQWSKKCLERQITRYGFWANNRPQKFIMLGNLVSDYKFPCMMDIKMGRRQHSDYSTEEKRKLLESRCAKSTSSTLGFRICGTQVYKSTSGNYTIHDKYYGRYLDSAGVWEELRSFFHNGVSVRTDVIRHMITKLQKLHNVLRSEKTLNLFSCSLLLLYDGDLPCKPETTETVYGHAHCDQPEVPQINTGKTNCAVSNTHECISNSNPRSNVSFNEENTGFKLDTDVPLFDGPSDLKEQLLVDEDHLVARSNEAKVDVRLIDFANVSEKQVTTCVPEEGESNVAFGLTKIVEILSEILQRDS